MSGLNLDTKSCNISAVNIKVFQDYLVTASGQ